jgi:hypothetical protein
VASLPTACLKLSVPPGVPGGAGRGIVTTTLEPHFVVDQRHHGKGPIVFSWHPRGLWVATTGSSRVVHIFDAQGQVRDRIMLPQPRPAAPEPEGRSSSMLLHGPRNLDNGVMDCLPIGAGRGSDRAAIAIGGDGAGMGPHGRCARRDSGRLLRPRPVERRHAQGEAG